MPIDTHPEFNGTNIYYGVYGAHAQLIITRNQFICWYI